MQILRIFEEISQPRNCSQDEDKATKLSRAAKADVRLSELMNQQQQRIDRCYMNMLRKMTRNGFRRVEGTFKFALSNGELLQICGTTSATDYIAQQQKNYRLRQMSC